MKDETLAELRYYFQSILVPCIVFIGVLGNTISVVVLTRRRMRSSTNIYLTALAIADIIYLLLTLVLSFRHQAKIHRAKYELYWRSYGLTAWICDASCYISIYVTVCLTIERYIAVCHPIKGQVLCTESRAKKVIAGVVLLCLLTTCTTCFEYQLATKRYYVYRESGEPCELRSNSTDSNTDSEDNTVATTLESIEEYQILLSPSPTDEINRTEQDTTLVGTIQIEKPTTLSSPLLSSSPSESITYPSVVANILYSPLYEGVPAAPTISSQDEDYDSSTVIMESKNFRIRRRSTYEERSVHDNINMDYISDFKDDDDQKFTEEIHKDINDVNYDIKQPQWDWPQTRIERSIILEKDDSNFVPDTKKLNRTNENENSNNQYMYLNEDDDGISYIQFNNISDIIEVNKNSTDVEYIDGDIIANFSTDPLMETEINLFHDNSSKITKNITNRIGDDKCYWEYFLNVKQSAMGSSTLYQNIFMKFSSTVFTFIPLILLITFNIFLFLAVRRSNRLRDEMTKVNSRQVKHKIKYISQENKITITLMAVVLLFIICQTPTAVYILFKPKIPTNIDYALGNIFNFLTAVNSASNFVLYCMFSDKYRSTAKQLFLRYRNLRRNTMIPSYASSTRRGTRSSYYYKNAQPARTQTSSTKGGKKPPISQTPSHLESRDSIYHGQPRISLTSFHGYGDAASPNTTTNNSRKNSMHSTRMQDDLRRAAEQVQMLAQLQSTPNRFLRPSESSTSLQRSRSLNLKPKTRHSPDCRDHPDNVGNKD